MFILDTNVVSELRKAKSGKANPNVIAWATSIAPAAFFISAVTVLELERGVLLAEHRDAAQGALLRLWLETQVLTTFADQILPVDVAVARCAASLHVPNPRNERDALIAATGIVHAMTIATRNVSDFAGAGVTILNPWDAASTSHC